MSEHLNRNAPEESQAVSSGEVEERLVDLEARLVEQDHRIVPVIMTYLSSRRTFPVGDRRRDAAFRALLWALFFSPTAVAVGGTFVAVITLAVLIWQNLLVREQNEYLRRQIDQQQTQIESQQRIDNQLVRNRAIEQIFGPEFANNPRVRAEAVRSLVTVERARIAGGSNTLPTQFINLHEANLTEAWLDSADLRKASFRKSTLVRVNLNSASLDEASIRHSEASDADFVGATMRGANVAFTNLASSSFTRANLERTAFLSSDLRAADLSSANLAGASFFQTQLEDADLSGIQNWQMITSMDKTNIYGVKNPPDGFVAWALAHGAIATQGALANLSSIREAALRTEETSLSAR